jgi:hypothetical protein
MRRIIVTPAGRQRYLERLFKHLEKQKSSFDEWHLWMNTGVASDIAYAERLASEHSWITTVYIQDDDASKTGYTSQRIHRFFPLDAADENTVYLRLDDDIVWLEATFVSKMFEYRLSRPEPFLVYGNIINNALLSYLHQRAGVVPLAPKRCGYACMDSVGWKDPLFAESVHRAFLASKLLKPWQHFERWVLYCYERCSINAVAWLGKDFAAFEGRVGTEEEDWLSVQKPKELQRPNEIYGQAVCVHFAFYTQREHLDATDILELYDGLVAS